MIIIKKIVEYAHNFKLLFPLKHKQTKNYVCPFYYYFLKIKQTKMSKEKIKMKTINFQQTKKKICCN